MFIRELDDVVMEVIDDDQVNNLCDRRYRRRRLRYHLIGPTSHRSDRHSSGLHHFHERGGKPDMEVFCNRS
jgi:hypothetical protein